MKREAGDGAVVASLKFQNAKLPDELVLGDRDKFICVETANLQG